VRRGQVPSAQEAYLFDRIAMYEGWPQRYGTQSLPCPDGQYRRWMTEDPERLNERRALLTGSWLLGLLALSWLKYPGAQVILWTSLNGPYVYATALSNELSAREIPGARFDPASFRARVDGREADCQGVRITIEQLQEFSPAHLALSLIEILRARHPRHWRYQGLAGLLARADLLEAIEDQADELDQLWVPDPDFFDARAKALIY